VTDCRECERKLEEIERLWGRIDQLKSEVASLEGRLMEANAKPWWRKLWEVCRG